MDQWLYGMDSSGVPLGLPLLLAQNAAASRRYEELTEAEKEELILRARGAKTESDMRDLVDSLTMDGII